MSALRILLSQDGAQEMTGNYSRWIRRHAPGAIVTELAALADDEAEAALGNAHALVLTGGEDVHPARYGRGEAAHRCFLDEARDEREWRWVGLARERQLPLLGICRGHQVLNVALGGSLVVDIPSDIGRTIEHAGTDDGDAYHPVRLDGESRLRSLVGDAGTPNSWHHQAVDRLGQGLRPIAWSEDGVVEALVGEDAPGQGFLLGVQWHPERIAPGDPCERYVAQLLLAAAQAYAAR